MKIITHKFNFNKIYVFHYFSYSLTYKAFTKFMRMDIKIDLVMVLKSATN